MNQKKAVFLFDYTGIMAKPWADAGYLCYCFDGQHPLGVSKSVHENILNVGMWFSNLDSRSDVEAIKKIVGDGVCIVFGFPECTDLTVAGARHFKAKYNKDPAFQHKAMQLVYLTVLVGDALCCKWGFENPVSIISTWYRKPDFKFNPCDYGFYLPLNDVNPIYPNIYPGNDAYNKKTCIWAGNGFKKPKFSRVEALYKDNPGWKKCGGKSLKTKNVRSATPRGFAQAVFESNKL
ncbi:MAG TPA: Dcm methylase [Flavobacteriales bacterium]|nr:Dcm methylase [Flavobacteriales bacterium]